MRAVAFDIRWLSGKGKIANRHNARANAAAFDECGRGFPALIAEGVKLFDETEFQSCLALHPIAKADFKGPVARGVERPIGEARVPIRAFYA